MNKLNVVITSGLKYWKLLNKNGNRAENIVTH